MFKLFIPSFLIFFIMLSIANGSNMIVPNDRKLLINSNKQTNYGNEPTINSSQNQQLDELIKEIQVNVSDDLYALSQPLFAAAISGNITIYKQISNHILELAGFTDESRRANPELLRTDFLEYTKKSDNPVTYWTWLVGRMLLAADQIHESVAADRSATLMLSVLEDPQTPKDVFNAWSWGYLLSYYASSSLDKYNLHKEEMINMANEVANHEQSLSNIIWTRVVELQAASLAKDEETYKKMMLSIISESNQQNIVNALNQIPTDDFRAWAISIVQASAKKMGDNQTQLMLTAPLAAAIDNTPNKSDKALAIAVLSRSQELRVGS